MWRFCLPLFPIAPVEWVSSLSDRYVIGGLMGLDAAGIYAASYGLISQPFLMAGMFSKTTIGRITMTHLLTTNLDIAQRIFRSWFILTVAVCVLGLIAVIALKSWIVSMFLAARIAQPRDLFFPIALGNAFFALSQVTRAVPPRQGQNRPLPG